MRESIVSFLKLRAIDDCVTAIIELCCYEAVANIIEHAEPAKAEEAIRIHCYLSDRKVVCEIVHYGRAFDLTLSPLPDIEQHFHEGKKQGLGIYMIRTLMNDVSFLHEHGRNTLVLTKNL